MKLIATKWVSDQLPEGASYQAKDEQDGRMLIATGFFRQADEASDAPDGAPPNEDPHERPRRQYRRRDLTAEGRE